MEPQTGVKHFLRGHRRMINLLAVVIAPLIFSVFIYILPKRKAGILALIFQFIYLFYVILIFVSVRTGGVIVENIGGWDNFVGITLKADILSAVMVLLAAFIFLSMFIYGYYKKYMGNMFLFLNLLLQALLAGIFLSDDFFNVFVLVELATIIVSILIMFKKDSRSIYDGMIYLFINSVAMMFFLLGTGFIYRTFGIFSISEVGSRMHLISEKSVLFIPYALMITSVSLKAAIFPLYSWLPKAHATPSAPSIVSAILSGLYVNSGIYLFIRIQETFGDTLDTSGYFVFFGLITGITGFLFAISQTDIKLILAYSTISQIGLIIIGLSHPGVNTYWGGIYHIISHSIFKTVLFLTAGIIADEYGTRDVRKIRGLFARLPGISVIVILAMLGVTGAPMFNGSISKYFIQSGFKGSVVEIGLVIINFGTIIYFARYASMFMGKAVATKATDENHGYKQKVPVRLNQKIILGILAVICFAGGIFGTGFMKILFGHEVRIDFFSYVEKSGIYLITIIAGWIVYNTVIENSKFLNKVRDAEISFNSMCFLVAAYFVVILVFLNI